MRLDWLDKMIDSPQICWLTRVPRVLSVPTISKTLRRRYLDRWTGVKDRLEDLSISNQ